MASRLHVEFGIWNRWRAMTEPSISLRWLPVWDPDPVENEDRSQSIRCRADCGRLTLVFILHPVVSQVTVDSSSVVDTRAGRVTRFKWQSRCFASGPCKASRAALVWETLKPRAVVHLNGVEVVRDAPARMRHRRRVTASVKLPRTHRRCALCPHHRPACI